MSKIVAYVHAYVPHHNAGAETTLHDILKTLVQAGWEADVVIKDTKVVTSDDYVIDGVKVHQARDKKSIVSFIANADLTISHLECSERTHLLSRDWKKPSIHLTHNDHYLTKRWSASADAMIYNTDWIANEFKNVDLPSIVVHPPVNPTEYKTTRGKSVTLINLWENKGSEIFYEMARRFPSVPFLGVKGGYGDQEVMSLPNVTIKEHTSNMKEVYGETKVLLMPSKYESFGRVAVEAMASGIPTIGEATPGLLESLGEAGIFADRNDPSEWEKSLSDLLKPAKYGKQSKLSLARSKELEDERTHQLFTMTMFCDELVRSRKN